MSDDTISTEQQASADELDLDTAEDISELEERGTVVHIRNKAGVKMYDAGTPVTMTVRGTYSKTFRRLNTAHRDKLLRQRRSSLSADQLDQDDVSLYAACVTAWHGFKAGGQPIPLTKEAVIRVFTRFPYVFEQVKEEANARENFSGSSSASSATP